MEKELEKSSKKEFAVLLKWFSITDSCPKKCSFIKMSLIRLSADFHRFFLFQILKMIFVMLSKIISNGLH